MSLLDRRLLVVTGKGGVGRTTTAVALAAAAARTGRRACVAELDGTSSVAGLFGLPGRSYEPRRVAEGVDTLSLTPQECLDDFGRRKLKVGALVRLVLQNRVIAAFLDAVPGLSDLLQLGKLENLIMEPGAADPRYDLVVLDAPATGHGLTLLAAARSMAEITRMGPFHELAHVIETLLSDPERSAIAHTTLPEELPVNESLEMLSALQEDRSPVALVLVNMVRDALLPTDPPWERVRPSLEASPSADVRCLVTLADELVERQRAQGAALRRLRAEVGSVLGRPVPIIEIPLLRSGSASGGEALDLGAVILDRLRSDP